ncbi:hypothetical protein Barb6_01729 [Bacteroidales bacterium Barb6]|nr:hypothetical protein Barb6_01729 [Bacteroidales bacterium Barb6]
MVCLESEKLGRLDFGWILVGFFGQSCILSRTENLKKEILAGMHNNAKGYDEIDSRLGCSYIDLPGATEEDVTAICVANGVDAGRAGRIWE